ncbi:MAG: sulfotransferase [Steroidobacteraceae bacterium]
MPAANEATSVDTLHAERLLAIARERSGLADMGDEVLEPLNRQLSAYRSEAQFSEAGLQAMIASLLDNLVMRLRLRDVIRRNPQIASEEVEGPFVIVGLSRSGTTKLQRVMAATGNFQFLPLWKLLNPLPLPGDEPAPDRRIAVAQSFVDGVKTAFPRFYAGHPMLATEPDEETLLFGSAFLSDAPCWMARVPEYQRWFFSVDMESSYRWLRSVLQLLQRQEQPAVRKRPWLLKAPAHLGRLDELFTVFPDAKIIHCHRDLFDVVPSSAALAEAMRGFYSDRVDPLEAGRFAMAFLTENMQRYLAARARWENMGKTVIDLQFAEISRDANDAAQRICERFGLPFHDDTRAGIRAWERANPAFKHGRFDYDLERYRLSREEIRSAFVDYTRRFGVDC